MKCGKLKPLVFSIKDFAYIDEPAAEKNFENPQAHAFYKATEVDDAIAELKQKLQDHCISCPVKMQEDDVVAELKQKLEDAKATAYTDSVDAGMENRRLKRALYKACANWAHFAVAFFSSYATKERWHNMEIECLKKAKEYK